MFRKRKESQSRRRSQTESTAVDGDFDVSSYRRGTTLSNFQGEDKAKSERQRLRHLRSLRRRLILLLGVIIGVAVFVVALLAQLTNNISGVKSNAQSFTADDASYYEKLVDGYFKENSFERFSFARRSSVLASYLREKAPEIKSLSIVPSGVMSGRLKIDFRQPIAMWTSGTKTSFVDENGIVFDRNYFGTPALTIEDNSGAQVSDGMATSSTFLSFVGRTATAIDKTDGLHVERVVIPKGSARYVEFYLTGRNYPFKAQISRDASSQAADIAVMVRYLDTHGITPQYVDCRVAGKAYWK